jgi:hypothetical protein
MDGCRVDPRLVEVLAAGEQLLEKAVEVAHKIEERVSQALDGQPLRKHAAEASPCDQTLLPTGEPLCDCSPPAVRTEALVIGRHRALPGGGTVLLPPT